MRILNVFHTSGFGSSNVSSFSHIICEEDGIVFQKLLVCFYSETKEKGKLYSLYAYDIDLKMYDYLTDVAKSVTGSVGKAIVSSLKNTGIPYRVISAFDKYDTLIECSKSMDIVMLALYEKK